MTIEKLAGVPVTMERDAVATMRDGTKLRADIYRPEALTELPVLLIRGPYDKRIGLSSFANAHPSWYVERGYIVVVQDVRGRFASGGDFYPFLHEMEDGYDSVEWAGRLEGSNGDVGMLGFSYLGATQLFAAVMRPPSLKAIAPGFTASQYYDGWTYNSGALAVAFVCYWANLLALGTAMRHGDEAGANSLAASLGSAPDWFWSLPLSDYAPLQGEYAPYFYDWIEHHTYDDYWRRWSIDEDYSRIDVPALHFGGWYDVFLSGTVKNYVGIRADGGSPETRRHQKLLLGPWPHMPWTPMGPSGFDGPSTNTIDDWTIRFFDQVRKGKDTGVFNHPVTVFTVDGSWRDLDDWPAKNVTVRNWFAHSDGRANSKFGDGTLSEIIPDDESPDIFVYDMGVPTPSLGGHSCCFDSITPMGPADQHAAEVSRMMLVYTSDPFAEDTEILGDVSVTLYAASTALDTDFTARLCVVDSVGRSTNLQEGIARVRYRNSLSEPELMTPGEIYEITIDLGPVGARISAQSRLRLDISSSDFPQWDRNLNTGGTPLHEGPMEAVPATQTVFHDNNYPTRVRIPIITN